MDGACAALRKPTAEMRVAEPELVAQHIKQRRIRGHLDRSRLLVHLKGDALCHLEPLLDSIPADCLFIRRAVHDLPRRRCPARQLRACFSP
jgi:hypothetical protein